MTTPHPYSILLPHPEAESADRGAPSGSCAAGLGGVPAALLSTQPPLTAPGSGDRSAEERPRARTWLRSALFWSGEVLGAASIFIILFILLFFGGLYQ